MTFLSILAALLFAYFLYGLIAPDPTKRAFAGNLPPDRVENGYLVPHEVFDPDEDALNQSTARNVAAQTKVRKKNAGRDDPMYHEPHWGHTSAILRGTLKMDSIGNLPEPFRVGLFAQTGEYPVVARVGIAKDPDLNFGINRLALKLEYPEPLPNVYAPSGEADELDLLMVGANLSNDGSDHRFFARDGRQLAVATGLKPPSLKTLRVLSNWRNLAMLLWVRGNAGELMASARKAPMNRLGWAGLPYYSFGPFALGEGAMKFGLLPVKTHEVPEYDPIKGDLAAVGKANMDDWLAAGETAEFALVVQLATPDSIPEPGPDDPPKSVMVAEYCDLPWDENKSPYVEVGRLSISSDASINTPKIWGNLQFNAWNTLPSMRPLGQLFRMRKYVHKAHSNVRVSHLFGGTPGELVGKCPFHN